MHARKAFAYCCVLLICCTGAYATDREFHDIVSEISATFHTQPMHIPFMSMVSFFVGVARPAGVKNLDLAVFENLDTHDADGEALLAKIRGVVGGGWRPFVTVRSHRAGHEELTLIHLKPDGRDYKMLITTLESNEATVIELKLNPEAVIAKVDTLRDHKAN